MGIKIIAIFWRNNRSSSKAGEAGVGMHKRNSSMYVSEESA